LDDCFTTTACDRAQSGRRRTVCQPEELPDTRFPFYQVRVLLGGVARAPEHLETEEHMRHPSAYRFKSSRAAKAHSMLEPVKVTTGDAIFK
jgi:hypothetical protein